jgi:class 3 adenylate cyclase/tetratricopeptide (TPR) repeat protein
MVSCGTCGQQNPNGFRFCGSCGSLLTHDAATSREVRKMITVLFSDLAGSTALGERLDPESLRRVLGRYFQRMREVLERHEGTVEKFIGDAVVAVFGIPRLHEDDALRAVRATVELQAALAELNRELGRDWGVMLQIRTGVNTGEVVAGSPAAGDALVLGDAANVAARLQQAAAPGEVLLGHATWQLVRHSVQAEPVTPLALKGKADRVAAWRLLALTPDVPGHARHRDVSMVGRESERELLLEAFDQVVAKRVCRLVTVLGAAGVGKSRLVDEALAGLGDRAVVLRGRCLSYGEGITFWPVAEVVRQAAAITHDDTLQAAHGKLAALLAGQEPAKQLASRIATTVGVADAAGVADQDSAADAGTRIASLPAGEEGVDQIVNGVAHAIGLPGVKAAPDETFWSIRKILEAIARRRSLVVCLDDVHRAEPTLLDLIEHLAGRSRGAPILLVCLAREELLDRRPTWDGGTPNAATIRLGPLSERDSGELIHRLLGRADLPLEVSRHIAEAAAGNPLFVEELVSMLIDEGLLRRDDGRWVAGTDLSEVSVPPSIQALLAARLEQLGLEERIVAERASVEGMVFHRSAVLDLCGDQLRGGVDPHLASLLRRELIRPDRSSFAGDEAFGFRHLLIRDAAYQAMPKELRAILHEHFADWLERTASDRSQEHEEILGYHLERAYRYRAELAPPGERERKLAHRAAQRLADAAGRATARIDLPAAANLLSRATSLLSRDDPTYPELLWEFGAALNRLGDSPGAEEVLTEAIEHASTSGDARLAARARLDRWFARLSTSPAAAIEAIPGEVQMLVPSLEALGDDLGLTKAWQVIAYRHWLVCEFEAMRQPLDRAVFHARRSGDRLEETEALGTLLWAYRWGPTPVAEGIRRCEEILREVRGDRRIEADVLATQGILLAMVGRFQQARGLLARTSEVYKDLGILYGTAIAAEGHLEVEMLAGDPVQAERIARAAYEERSWLADWAAAALAVALCAQERYEEAARYADSSRDSWGHRVMDQIVWRTASARALAGLGRLDQAVRLAREAVTLAGNTDALNLHGDALMGLAEVFRDAGRPEEAAEGARQALERYARKGNDVSARKAKTLLSELTRPTGS